ncbi:MAG TPA: hypothetical protein EYG81_05745 [Archaeoglobus profundus]|nr:hypothetical protein [Archaeoglobus profundus]
MNNKIVELLGVRREGLIRDVINYFGDGTLFVITLKGYEKIIANRLSNSVLYTLSEKYFELRLSVKSIKDVQKLVKQIVNELVTEVKRTNLSTVIVYRANDLPPVVFGMDQNVVEEEFWRPLTMDLRSLDATFMFVYEKTDYRPDILSQFADAVITMTSPPQIWSVFE